MKIARTFDRLTGYDQRALHWVLSLPSADLTARVARQVSRLGDGPAYVLLGLLLWLFADGGDRFLVMALSAFLLEMPVYLLMKNLIRRRRPEDALDSLSAFIRPSDRFSFPSGHTAAAFVMAVCVLLVFPAFAPLAFLLATAIGISRVLLAVHFPSDIIAGAILGSLCAVISLTI